MGRESSCNGEPYLTGTKGSTGKDIEKSYCLGQEFPDYKGLWKPVSQTEKNSTLKLWV